ncbi:MAG: DUF512 domain-containing protein [Clostridia bacterium]|nr:DUF512 domain-containing protein [Clostridia bacterium]
MFTVTNVLKESILKKYIKKGDIITKFCDNDFEDILDYVYADGLESGDITFIRNGIEQTIEYEKYDYETLGLDFDESVEIVPRECCNNCIFCFVQQLPEGMRDSLYVKDDDYRLSFTSGSYITGTNLREKDINRIIKYKLSPLYFSVHSTNPEKRNFLLGIKKSRNVLDLLKLFIDNGIKINTQVVMVGGINDGDDLRNTLSDLYKIGASTCCVVPVGLTEFRASKYKITPITKEIATEAINIVEEEYKKHPFFCWCSDEMYQIANKKIPDYDYYGSFPQIENGVGLIAKFIEELRVNLNMAPKRIKSKQIGLFTGVSGESTMKYAKQVFEEKYPNLKINIYTVLNDYFGRTVTVTGLVTATDIIKQYKGKTEDDDYYILPSVMLKEFEPIFLDNTTLDEFQKEMGKPVVVNKCSGEDFVRAVIKGGKNG